MFDSRLLALQAVYALNAIGLATWFPRIPDVKAALDLDILTLAFSLFGLPAGTMTGFLAVTPVIARLGLRRSVLVAGAGFLLAMIGPGLATGPVTLFLTLFTAGFVVTLIEVSMNAKAGQFERVLGRRLMTRCHAFWSLGAVAGGALGGAMAQWGFTLLAQQLLLQPLFALGTVWAASRLITDDDVESETGRGHAWPTAALLALALLPAGALLIEGTMMEWSALFLRQERAAEPFAAGLALSVFALSEAGARLIGDRAAEIAGPRPVLLASGLVMGSGILGFALAPSVGMALAFAAVTGAGTGNIYPLSLSLAARMPGRRPEQNVATLTLIGFSAFLIAPPLIGGLADALGLGAAILLLAPLGLLPLAVLARRPKAAAKDQPQ